MKAFAFGFGLNEEALTFSRLLLAAVAAAVLDAAAVAGGLDPDPDTGIGLAVVDPVADAAGVVLVGERDLPLNGGIAWMNIVALGFDGAVFTAGSDEFVGFEAAATFCVVTEAAKLVVAVLVGASGRRLKSVFILDGGT